MSVVRPARSLVGRCIASASRARSSAPAYASATQCLQFSTSTPRSKRRSQFRNVKATELGLTSPENIKKYQEEHFAELTPKERQMLSEKYTPEQLAAFEAGEKAIDPKDMIFQGRFRDDLHRPEYVDDYATLDPRYDLKPEMEVRAEETHFPEEEEFEHDYFKKMVALSEKTTRHQLSRSMIRALRAVKMSKGEDSIDMTFEELDQMEKDPDLLKEYLIEAEKAKDDDAELDPKVHKHAFMSRGRALEVDAQLKESWNKEIDNIFKSDNYPYLKPANVDIISDSPDGTIKAYSAEQPDLGKVPGVENISQTKSEDKDDPDGVLGEMRQATGMSLQEIRSLLTKTLVVRFVVNQTRLGKVRSMSVMVMAGNGNGRLGIGQGKSTDMGTAVMAATALAIRNMKPVLRYENRTIFGSVSAKVSGTVANLQARPPGFGLRVPSRVFEMCRGVGIYDLAIQFPRSKNPMNTVKAVFKALTSQRDPEQIAIGRGKKLVDARKVYYGGSSL